MKKILICFSILLTVAAIFTVRAVSSTDLEEPAAVEAPATDSIGEAFEGEEFTYSLSFWIFKDMAIARIRLMRAEDGDYIAVLTAETTGALGRLFRSRKDTYTTRLKMVEDDRRFITSRFEKSVRIGDKVRRSVQEIDYEKQRLSWTTFKYGKVNKTGGADLTPGEYYDDPLTAFYNLRYGVYGEIGEGRNYHIRTIPKSTKPISDIELRIAGKKEFLEYTNGSRHADARYYAVAVIDKEFFDSRTGEIEIVFSEDMAPLEAVAKNILFFGDIRGDLVSRKKIR